MKITAWNVRGLKAPNKRCLVRHQLQKSVSRIILLQETKVSGDESSKFLKYYRSWEGFFQDSSSSTGGLGMLWKVSKVSMEIFFSSANWMAAKVFDLGLNNRFTIINIYGSTKMVDKDIL